MGIFNFLKPGDNTKPSRKHMAFSNLALELIGDPLEKNGFELYRKKVETFFTTIIWTKDKHYVKLSASTFPTDHPFTFDIFLGEGNCDDFFQMELNSISISDIRRLSNLNLKYNGYNFPKKPEFRASLEIAKNDLMKYGDDFLKGDLKLFYEALTIANANKTNYTIIHEKKSRQTNF